MTSTKQIFFGLLALVVLLSGVSLVDASGVWKNPTATPPENNVEAPLNVGTDAQDKAGVLRVTGFRSFFDAIFDTKVQIGTTATIPSSLKLLVDGRVGAEAYCDRQGNNCVTSSGIAVSSTNNSSGGSSSSGAGSVNLITPVNLVNIGTGSYPSNGGVSYSSEWKSVSVSGKVPAEATGVLLSVNTNCSESFLRSNLDPSLPSITRNNSYTNPLINYRVGGGSISSSERWVALDSSKLIHVANLGNGCDGGTYMSIAVHGWK